MVISFRIPRSWIKTGLSNNPSASDLRPVQHQKRVRWSGRIALCLAAFHIALLAAYTVPDRLVPEMLRQWSAVYARPLFHQQWKLFAPDPPSCSCALEVRATGGAWKPLEQHTDSYMERRTVRSLARYVQQHVHRGEVVPLPPLQEAIRNVVQLRMPTLSASEGTCFRLVEACITDFATPALRIDRITELDPR